MMSTDSVCSIVSEKVINRTYNSTQTIYKYQLLPIQIYKATQQQYEKITEGKQCLKKPFQETIESFTMIAVDWLVFTFFIILNLFRATAIIVLNSIMSMPMLMGLKFTLILLCIFLELAITGVCFPLIILTSHDDCVKSGLTIDYSLGNIEDILSWFFSNLWVHIIIVSMIIIFMFFAFTNEKFKARFLHFTVGLDQNNVEMQKLANELSTKSTFIWTFFSTFIISSIIAILTLLILEGAILQFLIFYSQHKYQVILAKVQIWEAVILVVFAIISYIVRRCRSRFGYQSYDATMNEYELSAGVAKETLAV
ncbi:UNKNOWN [Stylonychia lemnae]|uniref:Transmembrane protein n=1 Tax=Stylonychia lemnae TaxID=5949 RepID=A0A078AXU9_STYLE|nr:UNKNOWN [Stylonychia lemnae]|eukprot:CDW86876.1 UNKNOWN [Stylonychia lemnae]